MTGTGDAPVGRLSRKSRSASYLAATLSGPPTLTARAGDADSGVRVCRIRVRLPDTLWYARFGRYYPNLVVEVLNILDLHDRKVLSDIRLYPPGLGPWDDEIRIMSQVDAVEVLAVAPHQVHLRVTHRNSELLPILREFELVVDFPFTVLAGEAWWVVTAPEEKIRPLIERLGERMTEVVVESIRHTVVGAPELLTARQRELLLRAIAAGYFEVPRQISLTRLAAQEKMAVSSLSQALAVAEKKILATWPLGAGRPPTRSDPS